MCAFLVVDLASTAGALGMPVAKGFYDATPQEVATLREELHGRRVYTPRAYDQLGNFLAGCRNPKAFAWAKRSMLCNANVPAGIAQVLGADPLSPRRHDAFAEIFDDPNTPHEIRERIFDLWDAARLIELAGVRPLEVPAIEDPSFGLTMNPHEPRLGRATLVTGWETIVTDDGKRVLDHLLAPDHDPSLSTILERSGNVKMPEPLNRPGTRPCNAIEYKTFPNRIRVAWHVGEGGMLRILESWAPGWRATVNGKPAPIYRADFLFLAVPVPEGSVEVELEYRPATFPMGVAASGVGVLALIACLAGGYPRKVLLANPASTRSSAARRPSPTPYSGPTPPFADRPGSLEQVPPVSWYPPPWVVSSPFTSLRQGRCLRVRHRALAGHGIEGPQPPEKIPDCRSGRDVTLIEREALEAVKRDYKLSLDAADSRRNILTEGIALNHLVGASSRS